MISEIKERCLKANAIILAHYYQAPEIQGIAHFIGDSLDRSRKAANNDADIIIFCGVHFMAETAKILSPNKTVLLPDIDAGCSLADDCPSEDFQKFRNKIFFVLNRFLFCSRSYTGQDLQLSLIHI